MIVIKELLILLFIIFIQIASQMPYFVIQFLYCLFAENGGYPPTQNGDIRSLF